MEATRRSGATVWSTRLCVLNPSRSSSNWLITMINTNVRRVAARRLFRGRGLASGPKSTAAPQSMKQTAASEVIWGATMMRRGTKRDDRAQQNSGSKKDGAEGEDVGNAQQPGGVSATDLAPSILADRARGLLSLSSCTCLSSFPYRYCHPMVLGFSKMVMPLHSSSFPLKE